MKALIIFLAAASISLNVALLSRLQYIAKSDISYVLNPEDGTVWEVETHAVFVEGLSSDSWLPYWLQSPIRIETSDSLNLIGHLAPITKKCDWRRFETYRELQRSCFTRYETADTEDKTVSFKSATEFSEKFANHPIVAIVEARIAKAGKEEEYQRLIAPIVMTFIGPKSNSERAQLEPTAAILFRGWAARNFEVAAGIVPPSLND